MTIVETDKGFGKKIKELWALGDEEDINCMDIESIEFSHTGLTQEWIIRTKWKKKVKN